MGRRCWGWTSTVLALAVGAACNRSDAAGGAAPPPAASLLAELHEGACAIRVEAVLGAEVRRGSPAWMRARLAAQGSADPSARQEEDITDRYLECTYRVQIGASYHRVSRDGDTLLSDAEPRVEDCASTSEAAATARAISIATNGCRNVASRSSDGLTLEALSGTR